MILFLFIPFSITQILIMSLSHIQKNKKLFLITGTTLNIMAIMTPDLIYSACTFIAIDRNDMPWSYAYSILNPQGLSNIQGDIYLVVLSSVLLLYCIVIVVALISIKKKK